MSAVGSIVTHEREVKAALRRANLSGPFVVGKYSFSPYMACEHGCLYCDGRAERYYVEGTFDRDIVVRTNLPDRLEAELPKLREKGFITVGSGISDAYQPVESRTGLMRRSAEILSRFDHPVTLMTKSALVFRDFELWRQVNERSRFILIVSLMTVDEELRRTFEPRAAAVPVRLEMMRRFREAGCSVGVLAMPVLPWLSDQPEQLGTLYGRLAQVGVDFIIPGGLTLRPGRQKDVYLETLARHRPDLVASYKRLYDEDRLSGSPRRDYLRELGVRFRSVHRRSGIPSLVPHRLYQGRLHGYDEAGVLLAHMAELYDAAEVDVAPLKRARGRYMAWLEKRKMLYNRHRSWDYGGLEDEVLDLLQGNGMSELLGNERLASFLREVLLEGRTFDYITLRLD